MTSNGGSGSNGSIFYITTAGSSSFNNLYSFTNGEFPTSSLTLSGTTLYGMTQYGGSGSGTIFSISTTGSSFTPLHSFSNSEFPTGDLTLCGTTLYGMTPYGGSNGYGSIFSISTSGSFKTLLSFNGTNGAWPFGDLTLVGSTLYGMTRIGGAQGLGQIFSINTNGTGFQDLISFSGTSGSTPGRFPYGSLTLSGSTLYGMTQQGGANGLGVVFALGVNPTLAATATATLNNATSSTSTFGPAVTATVAAGAGYAQLASYVNGVAPSGNGSLSLGTTAMIGGGINSTANSATVSFAWRHRAPNETSDLTATSPPMGHSGNPGGIVNFLASDVLQLTGMSVTNVVTGQTDAYGLSMSYNPSLVGSAVPFLATLLPNGYWENAINGNFGSGNLATPGTPFVESLATFMENNNLPALTTNLRRLCRRLGL